MLAGRGVHGVVAVAAEGRPGLTHGQVVVPRSSEDGVAVDAAGVGRGVLAGPQVRAGEVVRLVGGVVIGKGVVAVTEGQLQGGVRVLGLKGVDRAGDLGAVRAVGVGAAVARADRNGVIDHVRDLLGAVGYRRLDGDLVRLAGGGRVDDGVIGRAERGSRLRRRGTGGARQEERSGEPRTENQRHR